jgi:hypothetical protein
MIDDVSENDVQLDYLVTPDEILSFFWNIYFYKIELKFIFEFYWFFCSLYSDFFANSPIGFLSSLLYSTTYFA